MIGAAHLMMRQGVSQPKGLFAWGFNNYGQFGLGDVIDRSSPVQVGSETNWVKISTGLASYLIRSDGTLWACGYNTEGNLGIGTSGYGAKISSFVQVGSDTNWLDVNISYQVGGRGSVVAVKTNGTLWTCGSNEFGQLGLGDTTDRSFFTQVGSDNDWIKASLAYNLYALKSNGTLWGCGQNYYGELGLGDRYISRSRLVQIGSDSDWVDMTNSNRDILALKSNGTLWGCGQNWDGALGLGDINNRSRLTQIGAETTWSSISIGGGRNVAVLKTNGALWTWGANAGGCLGLGDEVYRSSPCQVGSGTDWDKAKAGTGITLVTKKDGSLWICGTNFYGQLGLGNSGSGTSRSSLCQVGSGTNWSVLPKPGGNGALAVRS